jgi:hypothetical protein
MKKTKTNADNLETRFDAGEDVLDYFDLKKAKKWGGARLGAGRKTGERVQYTTRLPASIIRAIKSRARKLKRPECEIVESALAAAWR